MKVTLEGQISKKEPSREFCMPYQISSACFESFQDDFQNLAVGMVDGAIVVIDLILGLEKHYLEKHPAKITSLAFFEDKIVVSGSVDGRINLSDLEYMNSRKK